MFLDRNDLAIGIVQGETKVGTKIMVAKEMDLIYLQPGMAWQPTGVTKKDSYGKVFSEYVAVLIPASAVATPEAAEAAQAPTARVIDSSGQVSSVKPSSYLPYIVGGGALLFSAVAYGIYRGTSRR